MSVFTPVPQPTWCAHCHQRVAPYSEHVRFNNAIYHRHCFTQWWDRKRQNRTKQQPEVHARPPIT